MNAKRIIIAVVTVLVLGFGYYLIYPFFRHVRVDEAPPEPVKTSEASENVPDKNGQMEPISPEETMSAPATISGTAEHPASGNARIVQSAGKTYLRYEDFKTINGPDIFVYLSKDLAAKDYVDLGRVRATEGNINYEIPENIDPRQYPYALIWCKAFNVLFNSAKLY